jgi:membrane protein
MRAWLWGVFWPRLREAGRRWSDDDCPTMAAAVAYYAALSLFPLTLLLISVLGFVLRFSSGAQNARQELLDLLSENASPVLAQHVGDVLGQISDNAIFGGPVALVALLLAAIGVFAQVERAFERIWRSSQASPRGVLAVVREALIYRLRAFLMLLSTGLVVLAALAGGIVNAAFRKLTMNLPGGDWVWARLEVFAAVTLSWWFFTLIYKALPRAKVRWSASMQGGILAALLWEAARQTLTFFLVGKNYTAYGVVGSLIAVMLWIYIAASVLFLGAEYSRTCNEARGEKYAHNPREG